MNANDKGVSLSFLEEAYEDTPEPALVQGLLQTFESNAQSIQAKPVAELLSRVSSAPQKYAPFFGRVSQMLQLDEQEVEKLLSDDGFKRSPLAGISYKTCNSPALTKGLAGTVVRFQPKTRYPRHNHAHQERLLILEGGYTDDSGTHYGAGDLHVMDPGQEHDFVIDPDGPCVAVAVADEKLQFSSPFLRILARLIGR